LSFQGTRTWKASPDPDYEAKTARLLELTAAPPRDGGAVIAFDQTGPVSLRPMAGAGWAPRKARSWCDFDTRSTTEFGRPPSRPNHDDSFVTTFNGRAELAPPDGGFHARLLTRSRLTTSGLRRGRVERVAGADGCRDERGPDEDQAECGDPHDDDEGVAAEAVAEDRQDVTAITATPSPICRLRAEA
jgi:hypothetical protein